MSHNPRNRGNDSPFMALRSAELDASVKRINARLTPSRVQDWEVRAALVAERDALRLKVASLESQLDELIDRMTETERRKTGPKSARKPTAPRYSPKAKVRRG